MTSMWTMNFQMFKLNLEKSEEPEIKLLTSGWIIEKARVPEKHLLLLYWLAKPLTVWITTNWKILKEMGIPDQLTCLLRNLYADQEATVRTRPGTTDGFQIGKGVRQVKPVYCHPALLTYMQSTSCKMPGWIKPQAGIKIAGRNINNFTYAQMIPL